MREKVVSEKLYAASPPDILVQFQTRLAGVGLCWFVDLVMDGVDVMEGWVSRSMQNSHQSVAGQGSINRRTSEASKFGRVVGLIVGCRFELGWWMVDRITAASSEPSNKCKWDGTDACPLDLPTNRGGWRDRQSLGVSIDRSIDRSIERLIQTTRSARAQTHTHPYHDTERIPPSHLNRRPQQPCGGHGHHRRMGRQQQQQQEHHKEEGGRPASSCSSAAGPASCCYQSPRAPSPHHPPCCSGPSRSCGPRTRRPHRS